MVAEQAGTGVAGVTGCREWPRSQESRILVLFLHLLGPDPSSAALASF